MKKITDSEIRAEAIDWLNLYSSRETAETDIFEAGYKAALSQTEQWIDVAAEKPENFISVLGITKRGTFVVCETVDDDFWISQGGGRVGVIAWQPLPQPPTKRKEEEK